MSLLYRVMYRVGFAPWDTGEVPPELTALVTGAEGLAVGRALDLGCGTGTQAMYLASIGWRVTAVDAVEQPLRRARGRADASGVSVDWIRSGTSDRCGRTVGPRRRGHCATSRAAGTAWPGAS